MEETTFANIAFLIFFSFAFKVIHVFIEKEDNASNKVVIVEEELDCIGNLEDLPRVVFFNEGCWNIKVAVDVGEFTTNVNKKRKPDVVQTYRCPLSTYAIGENVSSISMQNIVNQ